MDSTRASKINPSASEGGIALFMVISAVSILSILVTEFTYIAQVSQTIAFDGLDQIKAHYLAKSGLKLSLLRLKAYKSVKDIASAAGGAGSPVGGAVPKGILDKIWSFPFFYPIPTNIPGLTPSEKETIEKFTQSSGLEGKFSANIESESSRYNLNLLLAPFVPHPQASASPNPSAPSNPQTTPSATPSFSPLAAQDSLKNYVGQLLQSRIDTDPEFAAEYRDIRLDDFMDGFVSWVDRTAQRRVMGPNKDIPPAKGQPFYTLTEMHMLPLMDDELYNTLAPALTVSTTPGININTMQAPTLKALVPGIIEDEVKEFFKFRDSTDADNTFKDDAGFYTYLMNNFAVFRHSQSAIDDFKKQLETRNIRLVVDETDFKITVRAQVNQAVRTIEAWVTMNTKTQGSNPPNPAAPPFPFNPNPPTNTPAAPPDAGLKITYMRVL